MHFSGGHSGGHGQGHGGHVYHDQSSGHHQGGHGVSLGQILGMGHSHGGGFFGALAHALGLGGHHGLHHGHHVSGGGAPDQSPSWNMPMQAGQNARPGILNFKLRWSNALGFWLLFVFLGLWLAVIYHLRHTEPAENFAQLSNQLYTRQLPTSKVNGQQLPSYVVNDPVSRFGQPDTTAAPGGYMNNQPAQTQSVPGYYQATQSANRPYSVGGAAQSPRMRVFADR